MRIVLSVDKDTSILHVKLIVKGVTHETSLVFASERKKNSGKFGGRCSGKTAGKNLLTSWSFYRPAGADLLSLIESFYIHFEQILEIKFFMRNFSCINVEKHKGPGLIYQDGCFFSVGYEEAN